MVVTMPANFKPEDVEIGFEPFLWFFAAAGLMAGWNAMMAYVGGFSVLLKNHSL